MEIKTSRLLLREIVEDDWERILAYQSDARYSRFEPWMHRAEPEVRAFVQMFMNWQQEQPRRKYQLAIVLQEDGMLIGNCGIRRPNVESPEAEIGYEIDPAYWGHGYATEAASAMVKFGFETLNLHRIAAWCIAENVASARILIKLGMQLEGRLREREWIKGRWWDVLLYAILDREWRALDK